MANNRQLIGMECDMEDGYAALGHIEGIAKTVETDRYIGSVIKYTHSVLARMFDEQMDPIAAGNYASYNHIYEPGMLGNPDGRLWRHKVNGGSGGGGIVDDKQGRVREATFQFIASSHPILKPEDRKGIKSDAMSKVSDEAIAKLKKRRYIFYSRASMMEYGLTANVYPRWSKRLFVPTARANVDQRNRGNYYLAKHTQQDFSYADPQDHSGGPGTVGRFTAKWVEWWANEAPALWDSQIQHTIEHDLGKSEAELKKTVRDRPKSSKVMGIGVFKAGSAHAAFEQGRNAAEAYVLGKAKSYSSQADYVRKHGVYGQ